METETNCYFRGFDDIRSSVGLAEPEPTCVHGRTLTRTSGSTLASGPGQKRGEYELELTL